MALLHSQMRRHMINLINPYLAYVTNKNLYVQILPRQKNGFCRQIQYLLRASKTLAKSILSFKKEKYVLALSQAAMHIFAVMTLQPSLLTRTNTPEPRYFVQNALE